MREIARIAHGSMISARRVQGSGISADGGVRWQAQQGTTQERRRPGIP
ncbi:hypothetical protein JRG18_07910 [Kocuria palustris]|nr:hypothetical protein [Kocuria palustris]MBN6753168.1 hypothetical protein [Kocuria palustris]MBN6758397.1 hypothetical protein [Kocuria palustris]MBN6763485.1 hypothetical protein [Kocuria palustris]MBN6782673.1 hypothetical protein [Kocuria palustris]MBN6799103.1 hypothetical protein [Kocuria palustris]